MMSAPWMKGLRVGPSPQGIRPARQVLRPVSSAAPGCVKVRDVAQASHSPPRKARHASVAPADESATLERLGAAAPTEVLVALLGDVKQDLDRVRAARRPREMNSRTITNAAAPAACKGFYAMHMATSRFGLALTEAGHYRIRAAIKIKIEPEKNTRR